MEIGSNELYTERAIFETKCCPWVKHVEPLWLHSSFIYYKFSEIEGFNIAHHISTTLLISLGGLQDLYDVCDCP